MTLDLLYNVLAYAPINFRTPIKNPRDSVAMPESMTSLRILFISPYLPSLIRVRPYNWIRYLAQNGHQVTLLALTPANEDPSGLETLRQICHRVEQVTLPRWRPFWNAFQLTTGSDYIYPIQ